MDYRCWLVVVAVVIDDDAFQTPPLRGQRKEATAANTATTTATATAPRTGRDGTGPNRMGRDKTGMDGTGQDRPGRDAHDAAWRRLLGRLRRRPWGRCAIFLQSVLMVFLGFYYVFLRFVHAFLWCSHVSLQLSYVFLLFSQVSFVAE